MAEDTMQVPGIIDKVQAFLTLNPEDGERRLELFLQTGQLLFSTADVMALTGWSQAYVTRLCRKGVLPHIPGNPNKFLLAPLMATLEGMLIGGPYGMKGKKRGVASKVGTRG